jgi:hypothetical protein
LSGWRILDVEFLSLLPRPSFFSSPPACPSPRGGSTELLPPIIIAPTTSAKPPQPAPGCPPVPALSADATVTSITVKRAARDVGPFAVLLHGYFTSSDPMPSHRPFLLQADPGGSLVLDFRVDPSSPLAQHKNEHCRCFHWLTPGDMVPARPLALEDKHAVRGGPNPLSRPSVI